MRRVMLAMVAAAAVLALVAAQTAQAAQQEACHTNDGTCECHLTVDGSDLTATLTGTQALADVEAFESPSKARAVTWSNFVMSGETSDGGTISATLDRASGSSGTVLSLKDAEFPATATMRFFLRLETNGLTLVSSEPAVFQGIIHSIPPGYGDQLRLISGPVKFHEEGGPADLVMGTLNRSTVSFSKRSAGLPAKTEWGMAGLGAVLLLSGGFYSRRRTLMAE
jgi:hypothetical protein